MASNLHLRVHDQSHQKSTRKKGSSRYTVVASLQLVFRRPTIVYLSGGDVLRVSRNISPDHGG